MRIITKFIKAGIKGVLTLLVLFICSFNYSLYYTPEFALTRSSGSSYNVDVYKQLNFLKGEFEAGAGEEMQEIYPEGFIFFNALYGLAWADLIAGLKPEDEIYQEGLHELGKVSKSLQSEQAKGIFPEDLTLPYGAFYRGWSNYVLGKKIELSSKTSTQDIALFKANCEDIRAALRYNESPWLESYTGQKWPADGLIAVASLSLHDKIFEQGKYRDFLSEWLKKVKGGLDKETGLIPHSVGYSDDRSIGTARGSSQSLMLIFLKEIDPQFAAAQFEKYKQQFLDYRLGMPGIREYPLLIVGSSDVDSGPVIFGIGGAASIVGQKTMALYGEWSVYEGLRNCIETFGVGYSQAKGKSYLFGQLPMADAFIAWSNASEPSTQADKFKHYWRLKVQFFSLLFVGLLVYLIRNL